MRAFVKQITWLAGCSTGWGNGYVVIPKGHPLHGEDYENIDVDVHGGLTFADAADNLDWPELIDEDKGGWVVGFDTAHLGDDLNKWPNAETVLGEAERLKSQLENPVEVS